MKISELQTKLATIKVEYGDIDVWLEDREEDWEVQSAVVVDRPDYSYVALRTIA